MADEETELLDWGNEDDEPVHPLHRGEMEEDAVSLGGDEDDMQAFYAYQARSEQDTIRASAPTAKSQQQSHRRETSSSQNIAPSPVSGYQSHSQPQPHSQQQRPTPRRNSSQPKLTHELPPKPVLTVAPTVKETSTLASSMARPDRDRRSNGKPHSSSDDQLPPEWEVRTPRHGGENPYYYNTKTKKSQWEHPSGARGRESERERSPAREGSTDLPRTDTARPPDLSFDDRHYRPGGSPNKSADSPASKPETRSIAPSSRPRSSPTRGVNPDRRDLHRNQRDTQERSGRPNRASVTSADRPTRRDAQRTRSHERRVEDLDRTWIPRDAIPPESVPTDRDDRVVPSRRKRRESDPPRREPVPPREQTTRRDYSPPRYRSPSPMLRPSAAWTNQESSAYEPAPPPQRPPPVLSRQSSRFERPAPPSIEDKQKQARVRREEEYESYVPMDSVPQRRGREFELTSPQMEGENEAKRRRIEDRPSVRPGSQFPGLPARPVEEELPLRKRVPLPPQSERFREAATGRPVAPPQSPVGVYPESGPAHAGGGGGIARRPSINVGVPSGPRNHPPPSVPLRNVNHPDFAQGRLPPSGPSAAATRTRPSRFQSDVPPMQSVDRDAMEVDIPPASRAVAMNRAGPSAYDRDPQETLPKGPRAMAHRLSTGGYPVAHAAAAPPPTIMYPPRQTVQQEMLPPRLRDRSPPPHMARGDTRGLYPTAVNAERPSRFERTADVVPRDGPLQEITELRKGAAPDFLNGPRQSEAKQPHIMTGQKPKLSGTNSVPIANMRTFGSAPAAPLVPNSSTLADRYPVRMDVDREPPSRSRYPNNQEQDIAPYERGREDYGPRSAGPVENYKIGYPRRDEIRQRAPGGELRSHDSHPISPVINNGGGRTYPRNLPKDNRHQEAPAALRRQSRFDSDEARVSVDQDHSEARIWTPRGVTPPGPLPPRSTFTREPEYRPATPPPPSRDTSLSWRASQESMDDYHAGARSQERMHEDERSERARYRSPDEERGFYSRPPSVSRSERGEREYYGAEPSRGNRSSSLEAYPRGQYSERHVETAERLQDNDIPRRFRTEHRQAYPEEPSSSDRHVGAYQLYDEGTQQTSRWDRPEVGPPREEEPTTPVPVHPQRARIFEDAPQPSMNQNTDPEFSRTSKPVRIRRPPQSSQTSSRPVETHPLPAEAQSESKKRPQADRAAAHRGEESFERPGMRRGGSLLDRLSLAPSNAATSLRDRVQLDEQGNATASLLPAGEYPGEANDAGPSDPVGRKQKRRAGKPKRGRRGGP